MEEMRFLKRLDPVLVERLLAEASGEAAPLSHVSAKERVDRRRYTILLGEYGLLIAKACGKAIGGCYPVTVRIEGITDEGRVYRETLRASWRGADCRVAC